MPLDHAVECFAVDAEQTCRGLLVSARMGQHPRDVTSLNVRKLGPLGFAWQSRYADPLAPTALL